MRLDVETGLVDVARYVESPNCDARPAGAEIDTLVIHCISLPPGRYGGVDVDDFFCNCLDVTRHEYFREIVHLRVSAHFFVRRDGGLTQFVPTIRRAWHAGQSSCHGRENVNDFSIGIELEGLDDAPFTAPQYRTLARLTRELMRAYPRIDASRLVGHSDIAPGRKTDPGPLFDWSRYRHDVAASVEV